MNEWMNVYEQTMNELWTMDMDEWMQLMNKWMNEWMNEQHRWLNEGMKEWMNKHTELTN